MKWESQKMNLNPIPKSPTRMIDESVNAKWRSWPLWM